MNYYKLRSSNISPLLSKSAIQNDIEHMIADIKCNRVENSIATIPDNISSINVASTADPDLLIDDFKRDCYRFFREKLASREEVVCDALVYAALMIAYPSNRDTVVYDPHNGKFKPNAGIPARFTDGTTIDAWYNANSLDISEPDSVKMIRFAFGYTGSITEAFDGILKRVHDLGDNIGQINDEAYYSLVSDLGSIIVQKNFAVKLLITVSIFRDSSSNIDSHSSLFGIASMLSKSVGSYDPGDINGFLFDIQELFPNISLNPANSKVLLYALLLASMPDVYTTVAGQEIKKFQRYSRSRNFNSWAYSSLYKLVVDAYLVDQLKYSDSPDLLTEELNAPDIIHPINLQFTDAIVYRVKEEVHSKTAEFVHKGMVIQSNDLYGINYGGDIFNAKLSPAYWVDTHDIDSNQSRRDISRDMITRIIRSLNGFKDKVVESREYFVTDKSLDELPSTLALQYNPIHISDFRYEWKPFEKREYPLSAYYNRLELASMTQNGKIADLIHPKPSYISDKEETLLGGTTFPIGTQFYKFSPTHVQISENGKLRYGVNKNFGLTSGWMFPARKIRDGYVTVDISIARVSDDLIDDGKIMGICDNSIAYIDFYSHTKIDTDGDRYIHTPYVKNLSNYRIIGKTKTHTIQIPIKIKGYMGSISQPNYNIPINDGAIPLVGFSRFGVIQPDREFIARKIQEVYKLLGNSVGTTNQDTQFTFIGNGVELSSRSILPNEVEIEEDDRGSIPVYVGGE